MSYGFSLTHITTQKTPFLDPPLQSYPNPPRRRWTERGGRLKPDNLSASAARPPRAVIGGTGRVLIVYGRQPVGQIQANPTSPGRDRPARRLRNATRRDVDGRSCVNASDRTTCPILRSPSSRRHRRDGAAFKILTATPIVLVR
jgi:hypothetical protein